MTMKNFASENNLALFIHFFYCLKKIFESHSKDVIQVLNGKDKWNTLYLSLGYKWFLHLSCTISAGKLAHSTVQ